MATIVARAPALPGRTSTPPPHLSLDTSTRGTPAPIPNKHLPYCSPGPRPATRGLETPPASPPSKNVLIETSSILHPPGSFTRILSEPPVYSIDADTVARAVEHMANQPLPDPKLVFPWLHGLHAENQIQLAFFVNRKKSLRKTPTCIRGLTIVKANNDLSHSKLRGAICPNEILQAGASQATFIESDPKDGFSVRNFQIQASKMATVSDIIIYGDRNTQRHQLIDLATRISSAQQAWRQRFANTTNEPQLFSTFVVSDKFDIFEQKHRDLVVADARGQLNDEVTDFFHRERLEMYTMSAASEISHNVFMGPSPDPGLESGTATRHFDIQIECSDAAHIPESRSLASLKKTFGDPTHPPLHIEFPSSGSILPPTWSHLEVDGLMDMLHWIYDLANPDEEAAQDSDGDSVMDFKPTKGQRILMHCADGYTESSLLGVAYFMYAEGLPVHEAWIKLHKDKMRNFFAYPTDVSLLQAIQPRILHESPRWKHDVISISEPKWLSKVDGSLPSRILPYMYLGNLGHANNPEMLKELGIRRIVSVGESVSWNNAVYEEWGRENLLFVDRVQDNGVDPLTEEFGRCLEFIEQGKKAGHATLVHCRVGVSRSATICIAEVMNELGLSFPRAYCFVRARRLNVIIQPHLRFTYELLKWEEYQRTKRGMPLRRELEWSTVCREIAAMNKPYSRQ